MVHGWILYFSMGWEHMKRNELNRRDFAKLTTAALGGMMAGSLVGCGGEKPAPEAGGGGGEQAAEADEQLLLVEPHVCRGLNTCKNKGASKENECAGQGTCATAKHHDCDGLNECKGQGGCHGDLQGMNSCKEHGGCDVPLSENAWKAARTKFEELMKAKGNEVGAAPPKPAES